MSDQSAIINTLIQQVREIDPSLADVLLKMADEIERIATKVDPPPTVPKRSTAPPVPLPPAVITATYELTKTNVILRWIPPTTGFLLYEVRRGAIWDSATRLLSTGNSLVSLDPTLVGTTTFMIKSVNSAGAYSTDAATINVVVPPLGPFAITAIAIGNAVTMTWTIPDSVFTINFFTVFRDITPISAQLRGTFFAIQEKAGGLITYGVQAEDIAGNKSAIAYTTIEVAKPEDYDIQTTFVSQFDGTITNGIKQDGVIYYNINTIENIDEHFSVNNDFNAANPADNSPQDQINAGYPYWIQPTRPTGSYSEFIDFGVDISNTIISIDWNFENIVPSFTFGTTIRYDDYPLDAWKGPYSTPTIFAPKVRYVYVEFFFSGADFKALMKFKKFTVSLYVKRENDGGTETLLGTNGPDYLGEKIYFKKPFKFIESITVTPETEVEAYAVYDYDAVPDPKFFRVFMFNNTGARIGGPVSWKARGIL
jgi:hypothetical protein